MLRLLPLLEYGIVIMMGPCGFTPVWLSIFLPDMVTSVTLSKLKNGGVVLITVSRYDHLIGLDDGWFNSGIIQFAVLVLNGFAIPTENFTELPISVVNNT